MNEARLDALYSIAPTQFVAARDALVRELRGEGDKEAAAAVRALRRPSVPVWAANLLAREDRSAVEALAAHGAALVEAQQDADGARIRDESVVLRGAVSSAVEDAAKLALSSDQLLTASHRRQLADTLFAAATDEEARLSLLAARLDRELDPSQTWLSETAAGGAGVPAVRRRPGLGPRPGSEAQRHPAQPSLAEIADVRRHARAAETNAERAEQRATRLAAQAERLHQAAREAAERAQAGDHEAEAARVEAADLRAQAIAAAREAERLETSPD